MSQPEMKQATPEHLARVAAIGDPVADYIQEAPPSIAMEVLLYVIVRCFLDVGLKEGVTNLEAFDKYMVAARYTLDRNIKEQSN